MTIRTAQILIRLAITCAHCGQHAPPRKGDVGLCCRPTGQCRYPYGVNGLRCGQYPDAGAIGIAAEDVPLSIAHPPQGESLEAFLCQRHMGALNVAWDDLDEESYVAAWRLFVLANGQWVDAHYTLLPNGFDAVRGPIR